MEKKTTITDYCYIFVPDIDRQKCLAWLMFFEGPIVNVEWANVAKQAGGDDCGLFAIAFATSICHNRDPVLAQYKMDKMRAHLL